jgi:hypothetical protein
MSDSVLSLVSLKPDRLGLSDFLGLSEAVEAKVSLGKGKCKFRIVNRQSHAVQFKIKCDAPQYYRVSHSKGTIRPEALFSMYFYCRHFIILIIA